MLTSMLFCFFQFMFAAWGNIYITGANSGIGKEIATYAAAKGAKLYMLCRTQERAENARKEIIETTQNENIKILLVC